MTISGFEMAGDNPLHVWSGKVLPATNVLECTQADVDAFSADGAYFDETSTPRWTFIAGVLTALADGRVTGTWGHTPGPGVQDGDGNWSFDLVVGDPEPTVTLMLSAGSFNGDIIATLKPSGQELKFDFTAGLATLTIATDKATKYAIKSTVDANLLNSVSVRVSENKLYGV